MKKNNTYMDRALKARDPRYARVLSKLGYDRRDMTNQEVIDPPLPAASVVSPTPAPPVEDELTTLRTQYKEAVGRNAYYGWDAETLRRKINEARD